MEYSLLTERRRHLAARAPPGAGRARPGRNLLRRAGGTTEELPAKAQGRLEPGDALRIETPGGGGYGTPPERLPGLTQCQCAAPAVRRQFD